MAILASAQWWVRAGGNALNGGGFDSAISGAGTNYCDQDSAQLSLTDFATSGAGSTTLTSATGGFTAAMVGNCIRIASGTNFQTGYYFLTAYTDANTVTLDRTPTSGGAGSGGTGRLGGAFANLAASLSTGGTVTAPTITSPLAAGHTINLCGGGTDNPASADYTQTGYAQYPAGSLAAGLIRVVGYNGRPRIDCNDMCFYLCSFWQWENIVVVATGSGNASLGRIYGTSSLAFNCRVDQAGYNVVGFTGHLVKACEFVNSGSTSAGTHPAIQFLADGGSISASYIDGWRGYGINFVGTSYAAILGNIVANCKASATAAVQISITGGVTYKAIVEGNTICGNASDGVSLTVDDAIQASILANNIIYGNGGYGLNATVGSVALNERLRSFIDYNAFGDNTSGDYNGLSAGDNDITLSADPFTNAAGGDFTLNNTAGGGADLKGVAFPTSIP